MPTEAKVRGEGPGNQVKRYELDPNKGACAYVYLHNKEHVCLRISPQEGNTNKHVENHAENQVKRYGT